MRRCLQRRTSLLDARGRLCSREVLSLVFQLGAVARLTVFLGQSVRSFHSGQGEVTCSPLLRKVPPVSYSSHSPAPDAASSEPCLFKILLCFWAADVRGPLCFRETTWRRSGGDLEAFLDAIRRRFRDGVEALWSRLGVDLDQMGEMIWRRVGGYWSRFGGNFQGIPGRSGGDRESIWRQLGGHLALYWGLIRRRSGGDSEEIWRWFGGDLKEF